jgi:serine/threonine-protein kinase
MAATMAPPSASPAAAVAPTAALSSGAPTGAPPIAITAAPPAKKTAPLVWLGALVVLGAVGAGVATRGGGIPAAAPPPPTAPPPPVIAPPPPEAPPPPAAVKPEVEKAAPANAEAAAPPRKDHSAARSHDEALPNDVRSDLEAAEAALSRGDAREAKRLAQHSLLGQRTSRAFSILTRAACREGDLTNARAGLRNVGKGDRAAVLASCAANGLDLR